MSYINPETVAHNIAKIFCERQFDKLASEAVKQWKKGNSESPYPGDPDVAIVKALSFTYCCAYDDAYEAAVSANTAEASVENCSNKSLNDAE